MLCYWLWEVVRSPQPQNKTQIPTQTLSPFNNFQEGRSGTRQKRLPRESGCGPGSSLPGMCIHFHTVLQYPGDEPEVRQAGPREA